MTAAPGRLAVSGGASGDSAKLGLFARIANSVSRMTGRPGTFALCVVVILVWAFSGPLFHYSDTWQLIINTGTTIVTFLMVFLIQNTQNREGAALQAKLDELIRVTRDANNSLVAVEKNSEGEVERIRQTIADEATLAGR